MATTIEAQGHTVDEAIQIALNQLGVSRDKVEIDILHHPRRGLLGIGARRAKVRATIRASVMLDGEEFDMSGGDESLDDKPRRRRRRGGRNRTGGRDERPNERGDQPAGAAARPISAAARPQPRGGEERRGEGDRRGDARRGDPNRPRDDRRGPGRGDQRRGGENRAEGRAEPRGDSQQKGGGRGDGRSDQRGRGRQQGEGDRRGRDQRDPASRDQRDATTGRTRQQPQSDTAQGELPSGAEASGGQFAHPPVQDISASEPRSSRQRPSAVEEVPLDAEALEAIRVRAEELVRELLSRMGFPAEVSSSIDEAAGEVVVSVRADNEGLLIGRRGQTLDSLEHIVNRMALRGDSYVEGRVLLDIGDYRRRRRESLEELAGRLRERAVGERRTVQVSPMSPRDRKFFAQVFAADDAVEVRTLGAGFYRRVVVAPVGMGAAAMAEAETAVDEEDASNDAAFADTES